MSRVLIVAAIVGLLVFRWYWKRAGSAAERKRLVRNALLWGLGITIFTLAATGRIHWLGAVFAAALPLLKALFGLLLRFFPFLAQIYQQRAGASTPEDSVVRTTILEMRLNHRSGHLNGRILQGPYAGSELDSLDRDALDEVRAHCRATDSDSLRLLDSYLQNRFGETPGSEHASSYRSSDSGGSRMARAEALAVLGLEGNPDADSIRTAHRRLIQKLHPDRGGNDYLASKLNEARDLLLNELG